MQIILTHNNADFDAIASQFAASKLYPQARPILSRRLNHNVAEFIALYGGALPFVGWEAINPASVRQIIQVDTQHLPEIPGIPDRTPILIIDHHPRRESYELHETVTGDEIGAAATLLVEQLQAADVQLTSLEASLIALGIYEDTGALTYGLTTSRDVRAAAWLLDQGAILDTIRRFLARPMNPEQRRLFELLVRSIDTRELSGRVVTLCAAVIEVYVEQINTVVHHLGDMAVGDVLIVVVQMPESLQIVLRSSGEALDVGAIARQLGGGGHMRAAAASPDELSLGQALDRLWSLVAANIQPSIRVADLMSFGAQTVRADQRLTDVISQLRRIGHEGYPVLENGRVVGLLTRRDADRALEHGLDNTVVRHVMSQGEITLTPADSLTMLERTMVESGWGQIPVVDDDGSLIGIVTRTDLIRHWARIHPDTEAEAAMHPNTIDSLQIGAVLGENARRLVDLVARRAQADQHVVYMIGGSVRDLLLGRPNDDIDFVVEGDAIALVETLRAEFGGEVTSYAPFGTATWLLDQRVADSVGSSLDLLPPTLDFAAARNEFYEFPTALPTVYRGSIKLDLQRRDFTMNTLALQLSPAERMGRLIDEFGGVNDLRAGIIRVLHSLSFVDDPTRVLRAVRFEQRLNFTIEPRTLELIQGALPMLRRITGERVRNELSLILAETAPEKGLNRLRELGALEAIHPAFLISQPLEGVFQQVRRDYPGLVARFGSLKLPSQADLGWYVLTSRLEPDAMRLVANRLLFSQHRERSFVDAARLLKTPKVLAQADSAPSVIDAFLNPYGEEPLLAVYLLSEDDTVRGHLADYLLRWRAVRPAIDGNMLKALGLKPGPRFRRILDHLRAARLDGLVTNDEEEHALLVTILDAADFQ